MSPAEFNNAFLDVYDRLVAFLSKRTRYPVDLAHEAYERGYRYRHTFNQGEGNFSTWMHQIAINKWRDDHDPFTVKLLEYGMPADPPQTRDNRLEQAARRIEAMQSHYRDPYVLRTFYEMSYQEIAEMLDLPLGTVKSRIKRARNIACGKKAY